jgi:hypothetical protein
MQFFGSDNSHLEYELALVYSRKTISTSFTMVTTTTKHPIITYIGVYTGIASNNFTVYILF